MGARENLPHQVATLLETYKFLIDEGDLSRASLKAKVLTLAARMEDGGEVNALAFEGTNTQAEILYPAEVVLDACRAAIRYIDDGGTPENPPADPRAVFADFSGARIET